MSVSIRDATKMLVCMSRHVMTLCTFFMNGIKFSLNWDSSGFNISALDFLASCTKSTDYLGVVCKEYFDKC